MDSFYVLEAARAAAGVSIGRQAIERHAETGVETRIGWPAPHDSTRAIDVTEYDLACLRPALQGHGRPGLVAYLTATSSLHRSLRTRFSRWKRKWSPADGLMLLSGAAPGPLAGFSLALRAVSPSSLQLFAACPYRFALHVLLGLRPMEESASLERLDPVVRGRLFHDVQKRLFTALDGYPADAAAGRAVSSVLDRVLEETAAEYAERLAPAIPQIWHNEIERLRADLRAWLHVVAGEETGWTPVAVEHDFAEVTIDGRWKLRGRFDLVEQSDRGSLRITDYKTGRFPDTPPETTGRGEVLQPILYPLAAEQLFPGQPVQGGRLFYATLRAGYRSIDVPLNALTRAEAGRVLATVDRAILSGRLPAAPREDACKSCDYLVVCGPYEEERIRLKPADGLAELAALREIP